MRLCREIFIYSRLLLTLKNEVLYRTLNYSKVVGLGDTSDRKYAVTLNRITLNESEGSVDSSNGPSFTGLPHPFRHGPRDDPAFPVPTWYTFPTPCIRWCHPSPIRGLGQQVGSRSGKRGGTRVWTFPYFKSLFRDDRECFSKRLRDWPVLKDWFWRVVLVHNSETVLCVQVRLGPN